MNFDKIKDFTAKKMGNAGGHGFDHALRVFNMAVTMTKTEHADAEIVGLAALLHDVDDYKLGGTDECKNAHEIMDACEIPAETQVRVFEILKTMGYSKSLEGIRPETIEGKIVSDADMIDAMGAHGIVRTIEYGSTHGRGFFDPNIPPRTDISRKTYVEYTDSSITHIFEKLLKLRGLMLTRTGARLAKPRHRAMVKFLQNYFTEENATEWLDHLKNIKH